MNREFAIEWRNCQRLRQACTDAKTLPARLYAICEWTGALVEFANRWGWHIDRLADRYVA